MWDKATGENWMTVRQALYGAGKFPGLFPDVRITDVKQTFAKRKKFRSRGGFNVILVPKSEVMRIYKRLNQQSGDSSLTS